MATKLQNLASFWQNFGLANVQQRLDDCATEITVEMFLSNQSTNLSSLFTSFYYRVAKMKVTRQEKL